MSMGHVMPFGAMPGDDGVRFRLWAPAAGSVEVFFPESKIPAAPLDALGGGWFETVIDAAGPGTLYRFRIDGAQEVPDPASRHQPKDVLGPSAVVDPAAYRWTEPAWSGRPWHETVLYELHVGTFSPEGTFDGVRNRLDHLVDLGITAVELMPVADFAGLRNWGYDGVLPFAPDSSYGTPDDLKRLIDAAHGRGLMMFLDVVYNHFGPEGNFLGAYAPKFFTDRFSTPWGAAIDFSRREVRDFFIHNALYWLEEYRFDGLRLDAVHAIVDERWPDILDELAATVNATFDGRRRVHLVLENDHNGAHRLTRTEDGRPRHYVAQWNDDIHHALHVIATGEDAGYYTDYADRPADHLARCLSEGFAYQGEPSRFRDNSLRGEPSADLPATAFVSFLQNHDQVGNRAMGDRIVTLARPEAVKALTAITLLAPSPPLLFMGEEWGTAQPFLFFCDFHDALADAVREGRRREFARFPEFRDEEARRRIPDPNAEQTFSRCRLDWDRVRDPEHADWLDHYRRLLDLRRREVMPRLPGMRAGGRAERFGDGGLRVTWWLTDEKPLILRANVAETNVDVPGAEPSARTIFASPGIAPDSDRMPAWAVAWHLGV